MTRAAITWLFAALLATAGCTATTEARRPLAGTYVLAAVNGVSLPDTIMGLGSSPVSIIANTLRFSDSVPGFYVRRSRLFRSPVCRVAAVLV